jgi:hypothetical protein
MSVLPRFFSFQKFPDFLAPVFKLMFGGSRASVRIPGKGVARAAARLAAHRKQWDGVDLTPIPSRQQRRAAERANHKRGLHNAKMAALKGKHMGGAAACR